MATILIVDDEKNIRRSLEMILSSEGFETASVESGSAALSEYAARPWDLVFLDLLLPDMTGLEVFRQMRRQNTRTVVVIMSGHGTIENAVEAVKLGAYDFIEKPLTKEKVLLTARHALDQRTLREENTMLRQEISGRFNMVGTSNAMQLVREQIGRVSPTHARVLIMGESGTGKELVARAIHDHSPRREKPFVKVNCAAIPEDLIESELFGAVKGAFTGSVADREGKFSIAHGGTIFLDEVGDMSLSVQAKVLRVLQEGEFEKVGSSKTVKVDVRVLAATNKDLQKEVHHGRFREDLYFRLNVVPIFMPPLRERRSDIPALAEHFVSVCVNEGGLQSKTFSPDALERLKAYAWPGNIRELRNIVERLLILAPGSVVTADDLPLEPGQPVHLSTGGSHRTLKEVKEDIEKKMILSTLQKHGWNVTRSAAELGIERTNLHKKLKYYRISSDQIDGIENDD